MYFQSKCRPSLVVIYLVGWSLRVKEKRSVNQAPSRRHSSHPSFEAQPFSEYCRIFVNFLSSRQNIAGIMARHECCFPNFSHKEESVFSCRREDEERTRKDYRKRSNKRNAILCSCCKQLAQISKWVHYESSYWLIMLFRVEEILGCYRQHCWLQANSVDSVWIVVYHHSCYVLVQ